MKTSNLIIGHGQVGTALHQIFKECKIIDKEISLPIKAHYLHIAFPYSEEFDGFVAKYIKEYKPEITIIHSTVAVGTTRRIAERTKYCVIHSPMVGQHDKLFDSLPIFEKWIGGLPRDKKKVDNVVQYFKDKGLNPVIKNNPESTELAKLLSTTRYAINIAFAQEQERMCRRYGIEYGETVLMFEKMFNQGSIKMGDVHLVRPFVLPGVIGGHCLMPNIDILSKLYKSEFLELIKKSNDRKQKEN